MILEIKLNIGIYIEKINMYDIIYIEIFFWNYYKNNYKFKIHNL